MNNAVTLLLILGAIVGVALLLFWPPAGVTLPDNRESSWSPDGSRIAYSSSRDKNWEIYLVDVHTLEATRATDNAADDRNPVWAPGGNFIAFVSNRDAKSSAGYDIYTMHPVDKTVTRLTHRPYGWDGEPSWTPTTVTGTPSDFMVFASDRDGNQEIYRLSLVDLAVTRLTYREQTADRFPSLSPDGTKVAFQSYVDNNWEIFVMDVAGGNVKRLTFNPAHDTVPAWAPDGSKIAFTSDRSGNTEIFTMSIDGTNKKNLSNNPANDQWPTWSPDSTMLAFQSNRTGNMEVWRMNAFNGTEQKQLTGLE